MSSRETVETIWWYKNKIASNFVSWSVLRAMVNHIGILQHPCCWYKSDCSNGLYFPTSCMRTRRTTYVMMLSKFKTGLRRQKCKGTICMLVRASSETVLLLSWSFVSNVSFL
jgi:hypothetical protein